MLKFIHITDLHLKNIKLEKEHDRLVKALFQDFSHFVDQNTILLFTGDFSDKFSISFEEFSKIIFEPILEKFPSLNNRIFFVPGNHDLNRNNIGTSNKMLKTQLLSNETNRFEIYQEFTKKGNVGLEEFNDFSNVFFNNFDGEKSLSNFSNSFKVKINDKTIGISCLNTSWLCYDDLDKGELLLLENQLLDSLNFIEECDVKISLIHHPLEFLHESEKEKISEIIQKEYDLVFLGHTHKQEATYNSSLLGNCYFSIGKSLDGINSKNVDYFNGYSIVDFEPDDFIKIHLRKYNEIKNIFLPNSDYGNEEGLHIIELNKNLKNENFSDDIKLNPSFGDYINDVGANLTHKHKTKISLDDIFIFPSLQKYDYKDDEKNQISSSELILNDFKPDSVMRYIILGDNSSGKTSLSKKYFSFFVKNVDFYPIYIRGEEIKSTSPTDLTKLKNRLLNEQYLSYKVSPLKKPIFIIDDFNEAKLQVQFKRTFVDNLVSNKLDFIIFWDEIFTLKDIVDPLNENVQVFEILPFGIRNRYNLIKKWLEFDNEIKFKEEEKVSRIYDLEKVIDTIIGKNLVPSYPLFILTVLQTLELFPSENFEQSTQGHYYDVLIKSALGKRIKNNKEIERFYTYLKELSYYLYLKDVDKLTEEEFIEFHNQFVLDFNLQKNGFISTVEILCETNIFYKNTDSYKFKYDYINYYFLGKYLADNLDNKNIRNLIVNLAKNIYNSKNANIYLFLSHHSKADFVTNTILDSAKSLFSSESILDFDNDVANINRLISDTSQKLILDKSKSYEDYKNEELEEREKYEKDSEEEFKNKEELNTIDFVSEINKSFKTIEILGLILKNRYASIKSKPKETITEEVYFLGLRTTSSIFKTLISGEEFVINEIINIIGEDKTISKFEKEELAKKIMFNMYYMTAYSIIKKISNSIATRDLELTFEDVLKKYDKNNAISLIDISNKLDYSHKFPFEDINNLKLQFKNNKFPYLIMRRLAFNYLRMFPLKERDQQKICAMLEIPIELQRRVEMKSETKKSKKS